MPKAPTVRTELLQFLGEHEQPITTSITKLSEEWSDWRRKHGLPMAAEGERTFRQAIARLEKQGYIRVNRNPDQRALGGIEVLVGADERDTDRVRRLERERAAAAGRFVPASPEADSDLYELRTPHLNAYLRRRRAIEQARSQVENAGLDPDMVQPQLDPVFEEALAMKERLLRNEIELIAWRRLGHEKGLSVDLGSVDPTELIVPPPGEQPARPKRPAAEVLGLDRAKAGRKRGAKAAAQPAGRRRSRARAASG